MTLYDLILGEIVFKPKDFRVKKNSLEHYNIDVGIRGCFIYTETIGRSGGFKHYINIVFGDPKADTFGASTPHMKGGWEITGEIDAKNVKEQAALHLNEFLQTNKERTFELIFE